MILKSGINKKKDIIFVSVAVLLTLLLALYLFRVVKSLADRANSAFSAEPSAQKIPTFDFARYNKIMSKAFPSTSTVPLPPAR